MDKWFHNETLYPPLIMPITRWQQIYDLAEPQMGYFTTAQANTAGVRRNAITLMATRGTIERVSRGVYRLTNHPTSPLGEYMEAVLWPQRGVHGVVSHASALVFHELSDISPSKVHITISPTHRIRRSTPRHLVVHYELLPDQDVTVVNGVPVTTPVRAIRDAIADHLGPALIRQAIDDGRRRGSLLDREAATLRAEMEGVEGAAPVARTARRGPAR